MGEIVVILVVALLFFGPGKLPKLGDALGRGIRNFRRASQGMDEPDAAGGGAGAAAPALASPAAASAREATPASEARTPEPVEP